MINKRLLEFLVGIFMIIGVLALFALALKVSGMGQYSLRDSYMVRAEFDNVGDLKVRAPVTIAGVRVGEVSAITIDAKNFKAIVSMLLDKRQDQLPVDTTAKILTAGLIGANYIELIPGYGAENLKNGSVIIDTQPAIILENLIGQLIYRIKDEKGDADQSKTKK